MKNFATEYKRISQNIIEECLKMLDPEQGAKSEETINLSYLKSTSENVVKIISALKNIEEYYFTLEGVESKFNAMGIIAKNAIKQVTIAKSEEDREIQNMKAAKVISILSTINNDPIKSINQIKDNMEYEEQNYLEDTIDSLIDIKKQELKDAYQKSFGKAE